MTRYYCYQCGRWAFLFADSRCARCTRVGPDE
jgi:ribosomal protein L37E